VDVDDPRKSADGRARRRWRERESRRLDRLKKLAPGFTYYGSRGGYRLVWPLERPAELTDRENADAWRDWYRAQLDWLEAQSGIVGDRACADWTRLYRLPLVVRDGKRQDTTIVHDSGGRAAWPLGRALPAPSVHAERPANDTQAEQPSETRWSSTGAREEWVSKLAKTIGESGAWDDGRQAWALQMFGWLARCMPSDELTDLVHELEEWNPERTEKYLSMVDRVNRIDGPAREVRDALGEAFNAVDEHLSTHPNALAGGHPLAYERQLAESRTRAKERATKRGLAKRHEERAARAAEIDPNATVPKEEPPDLVYRQDIGWVAIPGGEISHRGRRLPVYTKGESTEDAILELVRDPNRVSARGLENERKQIKSAREIKRACGMLARKVEQDFGCPAAAVYDPDTGTLTEGYELPEIEPCRDPAVDAWLRGIAGEYYPLLEAWINSCKQSLIDRLAAALVIVGPKDVGKSLLFTCLAEMWGAPSFVRLALALEPFNAVAGTCPIWADDESEAMGRKHGGVSAKTFKRLTQDRRHSIQMKGRERTEVRGACRPGIPINDLSELRLGEVSGPESFAALVDRILLIRIAPGQRENLVALLDKLRPDIGGGSLGEIDRERIKGHIAWIWATVKDPPASQRFIGAGGDVQATREAAASASVEGHGPVFEVMRRWVEREPGDSRGRTGENHEPVIAHRGSLLVSPTRIAEAAANLDDSWGRREGAHKAVREALAAVRGERVQVKRGRKREWYLQIDARQLPAVARAAGVELQADSVRAHLTESRRPRLLRVT